MAIDRFKAHEISGDGLSIEGAAHFSSGSGLPSHTGLKGDWYFRTDTVSLYRLEADGSSWIEFVEGFNEDDILADQFFDVLLDNEGNVLRGYY